MDITTIWLSLFIIASVLFFILILCPNNTLITSIIAILVCAAIIAGSSIIMLPEFNLVKNMANKKLIGPNEVILQTEYVRTFLNQSGAILREYQIFTERYGSRILDGVYSVDEDKIVPTRLTYSPQIRYQWGPLYQDYKITINKVLDLCVSNKLNCNGVN